MPPCKINKYRPIHSHEQWAIAEAINEVLAAGVFTPYLMHPIQRYAVQRGGVIQSPTNTDDPFNYWNPASIKELARFLEHKPIGVQRLIDGGLLLNILTNDQYMLISTTPQPAAGASLRNVELALANSASTAMLADYIAALDALSSQQKFSELASALSRISPARYELVVPVAALRTTYMFRSKISSWSALLTATKLELEKHGMDAKKILRGLL